MANFIPTVISAGLLNPGDILRFCYILTDIPGTASPPYWGFVVEKVKAVDQFNVEITTALISGDIFIRTVIPKDYKITIGKY